MAADDTAKAAMDELHKFLSVDSIIGEPIEVEDKIILPVAKMSIIFGSGLSCGANDIGAVGKAGGGGGITPVAVVVISKDIRGPEGIRVMPIAKPSAEVELAESAVSAVVSRIGKSETARKSKPSQNPRTAEPG